MFEQIPETAVVRVELVVDLSVYAPHPTGDPLSHYLGDGPGTIGEATGIYRFTPSYAGVYEVEVVVASGMYEERCVFKVTAS